MAVHWHEDAEEQNPIPSTEAVYHCRGCGMDSDGPASGCQIQQVNLEKKSASNNKPSQMNSSQFRQFDCQLPQQKYETWTLQLEELIITLAEHTN